VPTQVAVSITTLSQVTPMWQASGTPPQITFNGNPFPQPAGGPPRFTTGYQVVVLDPAGNLTDPSSIRSNRYVMLYNDNGTWGTSYPWMYANVVKQVLTSGNPEQQIVIVASFGLDANMPPTADALGLFLKLGAGQQLQHWETSVDTGSQSGDWVGFPANYVLVGAPEYSYGEATEEFDYPGTSPVKTTVQATLTNFGG
jgi:hypothetical protein